MNKRPNTTFMMPHEFTALAQELFGRHGWRADMSIRTGIDERTLRRWQNGECPVPAYAALILQSFKRLRDANIEWPDAPERVTRATLPAPPKRERAATNYPVDIDWSEGN